MSADSGTIQTARRILTVAHQIETMAYTMRDGRDIPWHKLGTAIPEGAADARQIIDAARLDWNVELQRVYLEGGREIDGARAIVRDRDQQVFGIATDSYTPLQNLEAFETMSEWLADGRLQFETAGALGNGSKVWGLARIGDDFRVAGRAGDAIAPYCLLLSGHDGATSLVLKPVTTRVVCANTLSVAMGERGFRRYNIRHTASIKERVKDGARALGLVLADTQSLQEKFDILAQTPATDDDLQQIGELLFPFPAEDMKDRVAYERQRKAAMDERLALWKVYNTSRTVDRGTRWGVFNAVTEYQDHYQQRRGQNPISANADWLERRAVYSLDAGQEVRDKVFKALLPA